MPTPVFIWKPSARRLFTSSASMVWCSGGQMCGEADPGNPLALDPGIRQADGLGSTPARLLLCLFAAGIPKSQVDPVGGELWKPEGMWTDAASALRCVSEVPSLATYPLLAADWPGQDRTNHALSSTASLSSASWTNNGSAAGIGLGCSMLYRVLWDPTLRYVDAGPSSVGPMGVNQGRRVKFEVTDRDVWRADQFPWGGTPFRQLLPETGPEDPGSNTFEYYRGIPDPCWIVCSRPLRMDPEQVDSAFFIAGTTDGFWDYLGLDGCAFFWFYPTTAPHHRHYLWAKWLDTTPETVEADAKQWMGIAQYISALDAMTSDPDAPPDRRTQAHIAQATRGHFYANIPPAWNPDYPNADAESFEIWKRGDFGAESGVTPGYTEAFNPFHAPHIKVDSGFRLQRFEFARHPRLNQLHQMGAIVESATAEVFIANPRRVEFDATCHRVTKGNGGPGDFTWWSRPGWTWVGTELGKFGWEVFQYSKTGAAIRDDNEEPVLVHKVMNHDDSGNSVPDSDNTHLHHAEYERLVFEATGVTPGMGTKELPPGGLGYDLRPPEYIPRRRPWFSEDLSPEPTINQLVGARINIAAVGAQQWGHMVGRTEGDTVVPRSLKELERLVLWHANGVRFDGWEPSQGYETSPKWPYNSPLGNTMEWSIKSGYLTWLMGQAGFPTTVEGLENVLWRFVDRCSPRVNPAAGLVDVVPGDEWQPVNLKEVFQSILDDVPRTREYQPTGLPFTFQHQRYALVPCGTAPIHGSPSMRWDGEWTNLAPLFVSHWPREIAWPAPIWDEGLGAYRNPDVRDENCEHRMHGIRYQNWDEWRVRSVKVTFLLPSGRREVWRIRGPWD